MIEEIIHSDCIEGMSHIESESVALVIADPPYGIGYHSNHYKGQNPHSPITHDWNFQVGAFLTESARILKPGGALYLFCRWDVMPLWWPQIPETGLKPKTVIAWVKDNWSAGDLTGSFGNQYEQIIFATKGKHILRGKRWSNVWEFPRVNAKRMLHPAQKPVELLQRAIESSSDPGDLVVDPFSGSGSTGEAARNCHRQFILFDVDARMVELTCSRLILPVPSTAKSCADVCVTPQFTLNDDFGISSEDLSQIVNAINNNIELAVHQMELFSGQ